MASQQQVFAALSKTQPAPLSTGESVGAWLYNSYVEESLDSNSEGLNDSASASERSETLESAEIASAFPLISRQDFHNMFLAPKEALSQQAATAANNEDSASDLSQANRLHPALLSTIQGSQTACDEDTDATSSCSSSSSTSNFTSSSTISSSSTLLDVLPGGPAMSLEQMVAQMDEMLDQVVVWMHQVGGFEFVNGVPLNPSPEESAGSSPAEDFESTPEKIDFDFANFVQWTHREYFQGTQGVVETMSVGTASTLLEDLQSMSSSSSSNSDSNSDSWSVASSQFLEDIEFSDVL